MLQIGKHLASSGTQIQRFIDKKTRQQAQQQLQQHLQSHSVDLNDMHVYVKGIFYCLWMCDRPQDQQAFARQWADTAHMGENALTYIQSFWFIVKKEWNSIDRLRLNKYFYWLRCMHSSTFQFLAAHPEHSLTILDIVKDVVETGAFGLASHVVEVLVEQWTLSETSFDILRPFLLFFVAKLPLTHTKLFTPLFDTISSFVNGEQDLEHRKEVVLAVKEASQKCLKKNLDTMDSFLLQVCPLVDVEYTTVITPKLPKVVYGDYKILKEEDIPDLVEDAMAEDVENAQNEEPMENDEAQKNMQQEKETTQQELKRKLEEEVESLVEQETKKKSKKKNKKNKQTPLPETSVVGSTESTTEKADESNQKEVIEEEPIQEVLPIQEKKSVKFFKQLRVKKFFKKRPIGLKEISTKNPQKPVLKK